MAFFGRFSSKKQCTTWVRAGEVYIEITDFVAKINDKIIAIQKRLGWVA